MKIFNKTNKKESTEKKNDTKSDTKNSMKDLYVGKTGKANSTSSNKTEDNKKKEKNVADGMAYRILIKPLVTEKASNLGSLNKYFFAVAKSSNKIEISKAVLEVYGIKPISVNIVSMKGKKTRSGKISGKRKDWKKAIVTLPKGKSIKVYEGV